ncbi:MAG: ABC transporter permease [Actinomycetota bacterium]|nr:ABC transporter permease [Actinomycetota bacterium]
MTAPTAPAGAVPVEARPRHPSRLVAAVADARAVAWRNLLAYVRIPQLLVFSTIQPVVFVLLFRYVFGGAIAGLPPGVDYADYLMPGIFAQTVVFGSLGTAVGLATDINAGLIERFRSLPMARSAVLTGRTTADFLRNIFVVLLMAAVGFLVGFSLKTNWAYFFLALLIILLFGYACSWIFAAVGLAVKDPETAQAAAFPAMAPLVFASTAFVPLETMPGWLQGWAEYQPVSVVVDASRALMLGGSFGPTAPKVLGAVLWIGAILAIFGPLSVRLYRKAA